MGELGRRIHALRAARNMTVRALAEAVGKTAGYLSRVETRDEMPSPELVCVLADALGERPERLLELAKRDALRQAEQQIDQRSTEALNLYRRSR